MRFKNRVDAGRQLAEAIKDVRAEHPVVLGIPRGGVPVAAEVAKAIGGELAVIVARKLGAPGNPELAIGATTADGAYYLNRETAAMVGATDAYIAAERQRQEREAARREAMFDSHRRPPLRDRTVVLVDDGVATGATAIASVRAAKAAGAARVIIAVPVGPPRTVDQLREEGAEVVCLHQDPMFWAVGQYYDEFEQVPDEEVVRILRAMAPVVAGDTSRAFTVHRANVSLSGRLTTPSGDGPFAAVIFVHGLGSGKDSPRNVPIAAALVDAGMATVLFDLSGHGESTGAAADGMRGYADDLGAVFDWAARQSEIDPARIAVAGSSLGAVIAIEAAVDGRVRPAGMVLRAPPVERGELRGLDIPALLLIGSEDPLAPQVVAAAREAYGLELSVVEGAGHLFEEAGTLEEALRRTVEWLKGRLLRASAGAGAA